jgi:predicted nucleic acid-binding protein
MPLVVDASVAVKWLVPPRRGEADVDRALALLRDVQLNRVTVLQPVHWLAEVAAVLARLAPDLSGEAVGLLAAAEFAVHDEPEVYARAVELAIALDAPVFDTLYHAVALLVPDGQLVTADDRYFRKAAPLGCIVRLQTR